MRLVFSYILKILIFLYIFQRDWFLPVYFWRLFFYVYFKEINFFCIYFRAVSVFLHVTERLLFRIYFQAVNFIYISRNRFLVMGVDAEFIRRGEKHTPASTGRVSPFRRYFLYLRRRPISQIFHRISFILLTNLDI